MGSGHRRRRPHTMAIPDRTIHTRLPPSPFLYALAGLSDGGLVIGGCAYPNDTKHLMPWLIVLDAKGKLVTESVVPMQDGGAVLALAALATGEFAAAGISGNGLIDFCTHGANTWVRVMRPEAIDRPR